MFQVPAIKHEFRDNNKKYFKRNPKKKEGKVAHGAE